MKILMSLVIGLSPILSTYSAYAQSASSQTSASDVKSNLVVGQTYYISTDALNVRSSAQTGVPNVIGQASINDVVVLVSPLGADTPLVEVRLVKSASVGIPDQTVFVSKDYISPKQMFTEASKYFIVQNIASEKTRVYERCFAYEGCPHKMVFETDMVVGRPEEGTKDDKNAFKTWVGHGKISEWVKFYTDGKETYPSWYTSGQDIKTIPSPIKDGFTDLTGARKWLVKNARGESTNYGAFGWYAAKLYPEEAVSYQWIHGTIGWGKDGDKAIDLTRGFLVNLFGNPGSHGCTRLENRAVAYLRSLVPVGSDVYRVYAQEASREAEVKAPSAYDKKITPMSRYAENYKRPYIWKYILTTNGAQKSNGLTADLMAVQASGVQLTSQNVIEQGEFEVDQYPHVQKLNYTNSATSGKSGDRYRINSGKEGEPSKFHGYFLVDEGRFVNYQHPTYTETKGRVNTGGLADFKNSVPEYLVTSGEVYVPKITYSSSPNDRRNGHATYASGGSEE